MNMKPIASLFTSAALLGVILILSLAIARAAPAAIEQASLRASGGMLMIDDVEYEAPINRLRVSLVKKGDVCSSLVNLYSQAADSKRKTTLRLSLRTRNGCELSEEGFVLEGQGTISYVLNPKVIRRPLVNEQGHIYWVRDTSVAPARLSHSMPVRLVYDGEKVDIQTVTGFFRLLEMEPESYTYRAR
jgi:hypothetical protein